MILMLIETGEGILMPLQNLVIDDLRSFRDEPEGSLTYARNSKTGVKALEEYSVIGIRNLWLDHDLGITADGEDDTIMSVVDWLCMKASEGNPYPVEVIFIHTSNPVGRRNIKASLDRWGYRNLPVYDASDVFIVKETE